MLVVFSSIFYTMIQRVASWVFPTNMHILRLYGYIISYHTCFLAIFFAHIERLDIGTRIVYQFSLSASLRSLPT